MDGTKFWLLLLFLNYPVVFGTKNTLNSKFINKNGDPRVPVETQIAEIFITPTRSRDTPYVMSLNVFDKQFNLNLRRGGDSSIFAEGMRTDNIKMSWEDLVKIEDNIYVDDDAHAVLQVTQDDLSYQVKGYVNGFGLDNQDGVHFATRSLIPESNWCGTDKSHNQNNSQLTDLDDLENLTKANPKSGVVEIRLLYDRKLFLILGSLKAMTEHATIMIKAVNIIYKDLTNPKLQFKLIGLRELTIAEEKYVIENSKACIEYMLSALRAYSFAPKDKHKLNPSDVVALLTGVITLGQQGEPGTLGLAYTGGACEDAKLSVIREYGAKWSGVYTLAHQIGHNLGALHDFEAPNTGKPQCIPGKSDPKSFIMGYHGKTENVFKFSNCSKTSIKNFAYATPKGKRQAEGYCLFESIPKDDVPSFDPSKELPGQKINLAIQCNNFLKEYFASSKTQGTVLKPKDMYATSCTRVPCFFQDSQKKRFSSDMFPVDGTPCKIGNKMGICRSGVCSV